MTEIEEKLKKAKKGEIVYDKNTGVTYEILVASRNGGMPLTISRSGNVERI